MLAAEQLTIMRKQKATVGEYYHLYNRGINKQIIFHDRGDYVRFLFLLIYFQSPERFLNISKFVIFYLQKSFFKINSDSLEKIIRSRFVELVVFCIMPNHFHLIIKELKLDGVPSYMHRVLGGYSKYYNQKYKKSGHLFQNAYQMVHVENNTQLLYLSAYIHRNPRKLNDWKGKESLYEWSSYQDYVNISRFGLLLVQTIILDQFESKEKYRHFLESSPAKI